MKLTATLLIAALVASQPKAQEDDRFVAGQVLVKVARGQSGALAAVLRSEPGVSSARTFANLSAKRRDDVGLDRIFTLTVPVGREHGWVEALRSDSRIEWVQRNSRSGGVINSWPTNDPFAISQYALDQANDIDIDLPEAIALRGTCEADGDILVGIVDTGYEVGYQNPDLAGSVWVNPLESINGIDDDGNGFIDDRTGYDFVDDDGTPNAAHPHGLYVGGTLGAFSNDGAGIAGVASGVTMLYVKTFDANGEFPPSGPYAGHLSVAEGVRYCVDQGCNVINNSWTNGDTPSPVINDAIQYALDNGVHMVFGAANDSSTISWPAQYPGVIVAAATDAFGAIAYFSSFGPWVDLVAPGVEIVAPGFGGLFYLVGGTSLSSPYVAGVAALLLSEDLDLSTRDLESIVKQGADPITNTINAGYAGQLGTGHLNAHESLLLLETSTDLGFGLAGNSAPVLNAWGHTGAGDLLSFSVSQAPASQPAGLLVFGFAAANLPVFGGLLVPTPTQVIAAPTSSSGDHLREITLGSALPSGASIFAQYGALDGGAPEGVALSNAVRVIAE